MFIDGGQTPLNNPFPFPYSKNKLMSSTSQMEGNGLTNPHVIKTLQFGIHLLALKYEHT